MLLASITLLPLPLVPVTPAPTINVITNAVPQLVIGSAGVRVPWAWLIIFIVIGVWVIGFCLLIRGGKGGTNRDLPGSGNLYRWRGPPH